MNGKEQGKKNHVEVVGQLHDIFRADRPLVTKNNSDLAQIIALLHQEIFELNGKAEDGMSLEDYRAQEISDIQFFAYALLEILGARPSQEEIDQLALEEGLSWPEKSQLHPGREYEEDYLRLKEKLRTQADILNEQESDILAAAQRIFAIAVALHLLLGRDSTEEMRDKAARNILKHSHQGYDDPRNDYSTVAKEKGKAWRAQEVWGGGNPGFFDRQKGIYTGEPIDYNSLKPLTVSPLLLEVLAHVPNQTEFSQEDKTEEVPVVALALR